MSMHHVRCPRTTSLLASASGSTEIAMNAKKARHPLRRGSRTTRSVCNAPASAGTRTQPGMVSCSLVHPASCCSFWLFLAATLPEVRPAPSSCTREEEGAGSRRMPHPSTRGPRDRLGQLDPRRLNLIRLNPTSSQTSTNDSADDAFWSAHAHINTDGFYCQYTIDLPF